MTNPTLSPTDLINQTINAVKQAGLYGSPLGWVYDALQKADTDTTDQTRKVGSLAFEKGKEVLWAGSKWGYQSPESYRKIFGGLPAGYKSNINSGDSSQVDTSASTAADGEPDWTQGTAGAEGQAPPPATLPGSTTPPIPQNAVDLGPLRDLLKEFEAKRGEYIEQDLESALQRMLVTNMLSMRQTRENTKRQVELKNIEAWQNIERARIEANARQAAAIAQTAYLSQIPNQGVMTAMNEAFKGAMAPFEGFSLK